MVAFDAVGPSSTGASGTTSPLTWSHTCTGSSLVLVVDVAFDLASGLASGACTYTKGGVATAMTSLGTRFSGGATAGYIQRFAMIAPDTGAHTVSLTWSGGGVGTVHAASASLTAADQVTGWGTPVFADSGGVNATSGSLAVPSTTVGGLVICGVTEGSDGLAFTAGTQRVNAGTASGGAAGDLGVATQASTGGSVTTSWTMTSDFYGAIAVEILPAGGGGPAAAPAPLQQPSPLKRRRRFRERVQRQLPLPAQAPTGTASIQGTGTLTAAATISATASITGTGTVFASTGTPYIAGLGTSASVMGFFADQNGNPRLFAGEDLWGLIANAGASAFTGHYLAGDWQGALDTYFTQRAAQGYNVVETSLFSNNSNNNAYVFTTGQDWDGTWPFTSTNDPSSGLNSTFWDRRDYMFASAATNGFTVVVSVSGSNIEGTGAGNMPRNWTTTQWQAMGTALGNRYKNTPNILWILGDDYFDTYNTQFNAFITSLRATGDSHPITIQYNQESTSRADIATGSAKTEQFGQYDWVYTYNPCYAGIDRAFAETVANGFTGGPIPSVWADGNYVATGGLSGFTVPQDYSLERRMIWWALSEGARGFTTGDNDIYPWGSGSAADVTSKTFYSAQVPAIVTAFGSLTGWHLLEPDTGSVLVTAGRGTKYTGSPPYVSNTDTWVTASRTPDSGSGSSLAVIYMSAHTTITIDQTKVVSGYTATWIDPASGATSSATTGSTYNSTAKGSNSAGDTDWVLVLQAPAVTTINGTASITGAGSLTANVTQGVTTALTGAGSLAAVVTQGSGETITGAGTLAAVVVQQATCTITGAGTMAALVTQQAISALTGTGTVAALVTEQVTIAITGAGTLTASAGGAASGTATITGAGSLTAVVVQQATCTITGSGSVTASSGGTSSGTAAIAGTGSLTAVAVQQATVTITGAGTLSSAVVQQATAAITGAGSVAAVVTQRVTATIASAGGLSAVSGAFTTGTASLTGAGSLAAAGSVSAAGVATITGTGSLTASVRLGVIAQLAGSGIVATAVTVTNTATITGAGTMAAAAGSHPPNIPARSTSSVTDPRDGVATVKSGRDL